MSRWSGYGFRQKGRHVNFFWIQKRHNVSIWNLRDNWVSEFEREKAFTLIKGKKLHENNYQHSSKNLERVSKPTQKNLKFQKSHI